MDQSYHSDIIRYLSPFDSDGNQAMNFSISTALRQFFKAQLTILAWLGLPGKAQGFYIPYRYAHTVKPCSHDLALPWCKKLMDDQLEDFEELLKEVCQYNERFGDFEKENPNNVNQPRFNQDWFPGMDGAIAYGMVRKHRPKKIIEIGSGHSTRFMTQAIVDGKIDCEFHSVDPVPRRKIDEVCTKISRTVVSKVNPKIFDELESGDILFVDSSHIAMPGSDVDYLFTSVFPRLKRGVLLHVHDIFLPNGYPKSWQWRNYNEQNVLLAMLSGGKRYQLLFANAYMRRYHVEKCEKLNLKLKPTAKEASIWMKITD